MAKGLSCSWKTSTKNWGGVF